MPEPTPAPKDAPNESPKDTIDQLVAHLFRHEFGHMVSHLTRILGARRLELAEDAVQHAMLQALQLWPFQGVPDHPKAWLARVAYNRALDILKRDRRIDLCEDEGELELKAQLKPRPLYANRSYPRPMLDPDSSHRIRERKFHGCTILM